jgi:type I restriction enzyme M protein
LKWIEPPEKGSALKELEDSLWKAADQFRANSNLTAAQYSQPVLGLIFLRFADMLGIRIALHIRLALSHGGYGAHGILGLIYDVPHALQAHASLQSANRADTNRL